ncbi:hypothetical protein RKD37_004173 [Streptomyces ambofaciens]
MTGRLVLAMLSPEDALASWTTARSTSSELSAPAEPEAPSWSPLPPPDLLPTR